MGGRKWYQMPFSHLSRCDRFKFACSCLISLKENAVGSDASGHLYATISLELHAYYSLTHLILIIKLIKSN